MEKLYVNYVVIIMKTVNIFFYIVLLFRKLENVIGLQQPFKESIDETISDFLLFKENSEEIINRNRDDLQKLWQHRLKIIHTNVNQNQAVALNQTLDTDHRHRP